MEEKPQSNVVTFYSYKGGTGRTMALANVAWIMASRGHKVLTIDWDLEAPGLHRYFAPFLMDPRLEDSDGLMDLLYVFQIAAGKPAEGDNRGPDWIDEYADVERYAEPLQWTFPEGGRIDLLCAGRQDQRYAERVNRFDWRSFYERFGGAAFFEAMLRQAKDVYRYILIDSRTGVSDTSGICTVHLPDSLAVFYTLNDQSIEGASSVALDALAQRRKLDEDLAFRVFPVTTRVELAEKDKLESRRKLARERFEPVVDFLSTSSELNEYFGSAEILYQPFYAYEEILATIADVPGARNALLPSFELLTAHLTHGEVTSLGEVSEIKREEAKTQIIDFEKTVVPTERERAHRRRYDVFVSYSFDSAGSASRLVKELRPYCEVFFDADSFSAGSVRSDDIRQAIAGARVFVVLISAKSMSTPSEFQLGEIEQALEADTLIVPVYESENVMGIAANQPVHRRLAERHGLIVPDFSDNDAVLSAVLDVLGMRSKKDSPKPATLAAKRSAHPLTWVALLLVAGWLAWTIGSSWFGDDTKTLANEVLSARLTTASIEAAPQDPALSLILAKEAVSAWRDDSSLRALRSALRNSAEVRRYVLGESGIARATMSPDGSWVLARGTDGATWVVGLDGEARQPPVNVATERWQNLPNFSESTALMVSSKGKLWQWSQNGGLSEELDLSTGPSEYRFDPTGSMLLQLTGKQQLNVWSVTDRKMIARIKAPVTALPPQPWSGDGQSFAAVLNQSVAGVFRPDGQPRYEVADAAGDLFLDYSGARLASIQPTASFVYFSAGETRELLLREADVMRGRDAQPTTMAWNRDGGMVIGFDDGRIQYRSSDQTAPIRRATSQNTTPKVSLDRPGAVQQQSTAPPPSDRAIRQLGRSQPAVVIIKFAADDRRFLVVRQDDTVGVWDRDTRLITLQGHQARITDANWSADGRSIITASLDGTVRVWDAETGQINVDLSAPQLLDMASRRMPRELTDAERMSYGLPPDDRI